MDSVTLNCNSCKSDNHTDPLVLPLTVSAYLVYGTIVRFFLPSLLLSFLLSSSSFPPLCRRALGQVFDDVLMVDVLDSRDQAHLSWLGRPELGVTFTKLHCWTLIQYSKCVFLDADTLVSLPHFYYTIIFNLLDH